MAGEVDELVSQFKSTSISDSNAIEVSALLQQLSVSAEADHSKYAAIELTDGLSKCLSGRDNGVRETAAKIIAEISKSEEQRKRFTNAAIIAELLKLFAGINDATVPLAMQSCRALGNICYNNDDARELILTAKGDTALINLLDFVVDPTNAQHASFAKFRGGLISNYLLGGEHLAKNVMDLKIMDKIEAIVDRCCVDVVKNDDVLLHTLPLLSLLTENVSDLNFSTKLNAQMAQILTASKNPDVAEICLEMLHYQAENDDVKLELARGGVCETIHGLLETYKTLANTSEARALMKLACDLIVLILNGDDAMNYLYSSPLLKKMEDWLDSYDVDLLTTGVLALGNFARTDSHCIQMVQKGITKRLLTILSQNNGTEDEMRLQHALLSTLRNLVIPKQNKPIMIGAGLVQTILPMLEIHQPPVVYKLLGTLRMTVDGQPALAHELLRNETLIKQLVHSSKSSDYSNVSGESYRLMAWLVKHAYRDAALSAASTTDKSTAKALADAGSLKTFVAIDGTVDCMATMLTSQHLVMQNESLIALCLISSVFNNIVGQQQQSVDVNLNELFVKCDLGGNLAEMINRNADSMTKEIVENVQTLMKLLRASPIMVAHLQERNIDELLKTIPILTEYCTL